MSVSSLHLQIVDSDSRGVTKGSAAFITRVAAVGSALGAGPVQKSRSVGVVTGWRG